MLPNLKFLPLIMTVLLIGPVYLAAQAVRDAPPSNGKANQRRPAADPSPTPLMTNIADEQAGGDVDGDVIRVNTQLVSIPVRVMDKKGRFAAGLVKENFSVFEDGVKQEISMFSNENEPFTVALVLDMSYSTTFKIAEIQIAAIAFVDQLRQKDKVTVISFDNDVHVLTEATSDRKAIYAAINSTKVATGTSLYEAFDLVINQRMRQIEGRKAIILFTDGVDTTSRQVTERDNLADSMELDSLVYPIRYDTFSDVQSMKTGSIGKPPPIANPIPPTSGNPFPQIMSTIATPSNQGTTPEEYQRAQDYLDQLALRTGGRLYVANNLSNLDEAFSKIASELREFYSIGYYPIKERTAGKRTNVKVKVDQPGLVVRARDTYISPRAPK